MVVELGQQVIAEGVEPVGGALADQAQEQLLGQEEDVQVLHAGRLAGALDDIGDGLVVSHLEIDGGRRVTGVPRGADQSHVCVVVHVLLEHVLQVQVQGDVPIGDEHIFLPDVL